MAIGEKARKTIEKFGMEERRKRGQEEGRGEGQGSKNS